MWDVFISHASEDKEQVARPLAQELQNRGFKVWYDEFSLALGDSLRRSIDRGLAQSRFGVVILSHSFFSKEWPQRELDGLTSRETTGGKVILPVWHGISQGDVVQYSPVLADRLAVASDQGLAQVADRIESVLRTQGSSAAVSLLAASTASEPAPQVVRKEELPLWEDSTSTTFFAARMADAFPGARGLNWFESAEAVERLKILLRPPLLFGLINGGVSEPIWWFRGLRNSPIKTFDSLGSAKCLMNHEELAVKRVAALRADPYYQQFVYVEVEPEEPVYPHRGTYIDEDVSDFGFASEEYALFHDRPITREEFDDGSAVIDGAVVRTRGAKLRIRYLSRYNFVVSAKFGPYNSMQFDALAQRHLDRILAGQSTLDELLPEMLRLPMNRNENV